MNSVREKIPTANLAFLSFNFRISSCSFPPLNSFSSKNSVYKVKIEILRQLFQLATISKLRKEYFPRKLYEEIRYLFLWILEPNVTGFWCILSCCSTFALWLAMQYASDFFQIHSGRLYKSTNVISSRPTFFMKFRYLISHIYIAGYDKVVAKWRKQKILWKVSTQSELISGKFDSVLLIFLKNFGAPGPSINKINATFESGKKSNCIQIREIM